MAEAKVRLSFEVPGAQMLSSQECEQNPKESYEYSKTVVETRSKKGKKEIEVLNIRTRKCAPARQCISISKEAYDYMISSDGNDSSFKINAARWKSLSKMQRLNMHMRAIAESIGGEGTSYTFDVLSD